MNKTIFICILSSWCLVGPILAGESERKASPTTEALFMSLYKFGESLGKLEAFEATGSSTLELSPELAEASGQSNPITGTFRVIAKQHHMKVTSSRQNKDGTQRVIEFLSDPDHSATIAIGSKGEREASVGKGGPQGPSHIHPIFANYGFLFPRFDGDDLAAPPVHLLRDRAFWEAAGLRVQTVLSSSDTGFQVKLQVTDGQFVEVQSLKQMHPNGVDHALVPSVISRFDPAGGLQTKLEVSEWLWDPIIGPIARKLVLTTNPPSEPDGKRAATWRRLTMRVESWNSNPPIEESDISFDPASVDVIYDRESKIEIRVPR